MIRRSFRTWHRSARAAVAAALVSAAGGVYSVALADALEPAPSQIEVETITGRDFAGLELPAAPQQMPMEFAAMRAWSWRESTTNRLYLERDVHVKIGGYTFVADAATVWLEPVTVGGQDAEQLAVFFDNARDPAGAPDAAASGSTVSQSGRRLLVTGLIVTQGGGMPPLRADLLREGRPEKPLLIEGEERLARYLRRLIAPDEQTAAAGTTGGRGPGRLSPDERMPAGYAPTVRPLDGGKSEPETDVTATGVGGPPPTGVGGRDLTVDTRTGVYAPDRRPAVLAKEGTITFYAPDSQLIDATNPDGSPSRSIALTGGITAQYDTVGRKQSVQLNAQRAVVFLKAKPEAEGGKKSALRFDSQTVSGVYLEGDVQVTARNRPDASSKIITGPDQYTLRGSRVYYDVQKNSAVVLDAVFWTYDDERGMPLYLRAETIRQESLEQFTAKKATLANVAFAEPHFAIGASSITITRGKNPEGGQRNTYDARDVVFTAGGVPLAYVPKVAGEFKPSPLRRIEFERVARSNVVRGVWDMYTLLGLDAPKGNRWELLTDAYLGRGPGIGIDLKFQRDEINADALLYYIHDTGEDHLSSGADRDPPKENRGLAVGDGIWRLDDHWTLFAEGTYISDEAFIDSFFRREAETRREYVTSVYLRRIEDTEGITFEARGTVNDFISNEYLLESLGYSTQKLPEAQYFRLGESLFDGLLIYSGHLSVSRMNLVFNDPQLKDQGYDTTKRSQTGFGLNPDDRLSTVLEGRGFNEDTVTRFDSRHEIEAPLTSGQLNIVPFAVARVTAYDTDFADYNGGDGENRRLWGSVGMRLSTTIQKIDQGVESDFFDLHGLRHIITPNATLWTSGTDVTQNELPIYDESVESIANGSAVRMGVTNVWQTHRPGTAPGTQNQLRSVDWLKINTDYVWSSGEVDIESPFGRFIEARPENSNLGEFVQNDLVLQATDALAITSDFLYDVNANEPSRITGGVIVDHGFGFSTFAEYRSLEQLSARYLDFGARYEITRKYAVTADSVYDLDRDEFQSIGGRLVRRFPQWTVEVGFKVSTITDEVNFGFVFSPVGASGEDRRRIFTRDYDDVAPGGRERNAVRDRMDTGPFAE